MATWPWFAYENVAYYVYTGPTPSGGGDPGNAAPKATLSASSTSVSVPGAVTLNAAATDSDGTVAKVQFYSGTSMIGEVSSAPFALNYNVSVGNLWSSPGGDIDLPGRFG